MKSIKLALMAGAAIAVSAAAAQADDLDALKAQIEALNTRVAAMEAAPAVPAGYQLIAVSEGALQQTPGLEMSNREKFNYGNKSTVISVLPTADAPAGAMISWSGYARAAFVYRSTDAEVSFQERNNGAWVDDGSEDFSGDDSDVFARGAVRVKASTDTAVGEVGVDIRMRAEIYDGIEDELGSNFAMDIAWGYWAMTPELTFGGGYAGTLGNIAYGFDGGCTCMYIDTLGLDPGDTSQLRLTYASGPFSVAVALEDATVTNSDFTYYDDTNILESATDDRLGVAGEIKYSGDTFSGEISGVWRDIDEDEWENTWVADYLPDAWWQVGAGVQFGLADFASISVAAALGEGPVALIDDAYGTDFYYPWNNQWWAVSAVASFNLNDEIHAEIGGGYRERDFDEVTEDEDTYSAKSEYWVVGGGLYYTPVEQLTIGLEASYAETTATFNEDDANNPNYDDRAKLDADSVVVDLVSVWRF